jgi:asparagine synthase (glutamine-hydrolysing)
MCGICGVVQVGGEPREIVSQALLDSMTDVMTHRGPDDRGTYLAPGIALGVRRLSIVDVEGGHQPVLNEDRSVVAIQNGELYNHANVRRELQGGGHEFESRCDTEVLPHIYELNGPSFPKQLRGKFAIAVWDNRRRRAVLARDRLGVKPLYWTRRGDLVVFASELKAVLASGLVEATLDMEAIDLYLSLGFIPGPRTPLVGVRKLAPGSVLTIDADDVREEPYWRYPEPNADPQPRPIEEYADELLELLRAAVRDRLMSDVPLGAMLSGGVDSSLIVALMAEASSRHVITFAVGFREDEANELADARRVAETFGCEHHELELSVTENALELDELVWHLDEPIADLSALGFDVLSRLAAQHVTVALAGQGADELFGGYTKHRAAAQIRPFLALPPAVR